MPFLKKFLLALAALILILWGGAGTQSTSLLLQGGGFIVLLIGLIVLYLFGKMAWRAMGCLPSLAIIGAIVFFIMYAIGAFNNGIYGVGDNIKSFLGQKDGSSMPMFATQEDGYSMSENFSSSAPPQEDQPGMLDGIMGSLGGGKPSGGSQGMNIDAYPLIQGTATVVKANTLIINGKYFVLYGIDAPEANQTCADSKGRAYNCGAQSSRWLRSWINDFVLECRVVKANSKGNMLGTCNLGEYDIGAALVNAGWAIAYTKDTDIYKPYEVQAQREGRGLWQGEFYMPADWRRLQSRKPKIKVIKPVDEKATFFGI
jgi:endonuclease YncB( thermonuclease family)